MNVLVRWKEERKIKKSTINSLAPSSSISIIDIGKFLSFLYSDSISENTLRLMLQVTQINLKRWRKIYKTFVFKLKSKKAFVE